MPKELILDSPNTVMHADTEPHSTGRETAQAETKGIFDVLLLLAAHKFSIIGAMLAGGAVAAVLAFLTPNTYTATAVIMPPQQAQSSAGALLGQLGPLAMMAGRDLGLKNPSDLYIGLLGSRTVADHLVDRFRLKSVYKAKTMTDARRRLQAHRRLTAGRDQLIRIEVEDTDPARAAALANAYVAELSNVNCSMVVTDAAQRRAFFEEQLKAEKAVLTSVEDAMKKTQQRTGVIQMEGQAQLAMMSIAQIRAQITAGEMALQRLKTGATADNPDVRRAEAGLDALRAQLRTLQQSSPHDSGDPLVPTSAMPEVGLEYVRRMRDLKYHEFLFEMLAKQYEAARVDESKAAPVIQIIDDAVPPERKSGPHRLFLIFVGAMMPGALAALLVYFRSGPGHTKRLEKSRALSDALLSVRSTGRKGDLA